MKRITLSVVAFGAMMTGTTLFAQKLTTVPVSAESYASAKVSYKLRNQQAVQDAFRKEKTSYLLDFSGSLSKSLSPKIMESANLAVTKADYVNYSNKESINELLTTKPQILTVQLPFKGEILTVDLVKTDLFGDGFKVSTSAGDPGKISTGVYYQGTLRDKNAMASFSFFENEFSALIITDEAENSIIEAGFMLSDENKEGTHIIYADDDMKISFNKPCESESLAQYHEAIEQLKGEKISTSSDKATLKCVTYYWETAYNMYQYFGSTQAVTNYMTTLFNNFQLVFNNESIGSKLNQVYVWTTADSYNNDLDLFSANRSGFNSNLAVLFSRTGGGGVAWLNTVCQSGEYYRHAFCGSMGANIPAFPNYSWPLNVSTHEVGHNLGSPHTHACSWTGGAIDGCGAQAGYSEGCTGPIPSSAQKGTIMSYCHLLSNVGINIANGFGPQPGNLVRSRVNSCITLTCETDGGPGPGTDPCIAAFEPNESQPAAAAINAGISNSAAVSTSTDIDFFKITTSGTSNIVYNLVGPSGVDYDLTIYNSAGTQLGTGTSGSATESVSLTNQVAGTYYIKVFGYNGANSQTCYTIAATVTPTGGSCGTAFEPNESTSAAASITYGSTNSAAITTATDKDYFKIVTTATANNTYKLTGPSGVDFDLKIYNSAGTQVGSGTSGTATETVTINNQAAGTYYAYVYGYNGANSATCYTLRVAASGTSFSGDERTIEERLSVYPNPTNDKLFLGGQYSGKLINSVGQTVLVFEKAEQLSLSDLKAGVYMLQVEGITEIHRVVKE